MQKALAILGVVAIVLSFTFGIHGCYRDLIADSLHEDCFLCDGYRFMQADNAAFQVRESRRAERTRHEATQD